MKKYLFVSLFLILLSISSVFAKSFTDLPETHWAYQYVNELSDKGIISGYSDNTFKPGNTIKKSEFLKMIISTIYTDEEIDKFNEGKELATWYDKYVNVAYDKSLAGSIWSDHDLNKPAYRIDIVTTLYNVCTYLNIGVDNISNNDLDLTNEYDIDTLKTALMELSLTKKKSLTDKETLDAIKKLSKSNYDKFYKYLEENCSKILFTDADKLTEINKEKLTFIKSLRLINGYEDGTFRPYNKITRAEVATIISRYMDLVK